MTEPILPEFPSTTMTRTEPSLDFTSNRALERNAGGHAGIVGCLFEREVKRIPGDFGFLGGVVALDQKDVKIVGPARLPFVREPGPET